MGECYICCVKQKTAYEMRISDWSSDVCSSDLIAELFVSGAPDGDPGETVLRYLVAGARITHFRPQVSRLSHGEAEVACDHNNSDLSERVVQRRYQLGFLSTIHAILHRSEEHTSELQSLMRNSYADFCLKKK